MMLVRKTGTDRQLAVVFFDELSNHPHSQACTNAFLGRQEGLKYLLQRRARHACSRVPDGDANALGRTGSPVQRVRDPNAKSSWREHGIGGVVDDVGENLLDLTGRTQERGVPSGLDDHFDPRQLELGTKESQCAFYQVQRRAMGGLLGGARKRQGLAADLGDTA